MAENNFVPPPTESPQAFIMRLAEFLSEDDFEEALTEFLRNNAEKIAFTTRDQEQSLETYGIYKEFLALVEGKLEGFAAKEGHSLDHFQEICKEAKELDSSANMFLDALIASWDFDVFMELVQAFKQEQLEAGDMDEGNEDVDGTSEDETHAEGNNEEIYM